MNQRNNPNQSERKLLTVSDRDIFVTTQKALLVGIILKNEIRADKEESLKELINLVKTAGSSPTIIQTKRVERVDPSSFKNLRPPPSFFSENFNVPVIVSPEIDTKFSSYGSGGDEAGIHCELVGSI